jgi:DNA-binding NarL/FixJ family response regulator
MATAEQTACIRVAVVAADPVLRRSCIDLFDTSPDCYLVALMYTVDDAVAGLPPLAPDVVVIDGARNGSADGNDAAEFMRGAVAASIVVLAPCPSGDSSPGIVSRSPDEILEAVRSCGKSRAVVRSQRSGNELAAAYDKLTLREREVLEMLVRSYSYKDIAKRLAVSISTVGTHVHHIYEKLQLTTRREIIEFFDCRRNLSLESPADRPCWSAVPEAFPESATRAT